MPETWFLCFYMVVYWDNFRKNRWPEPSPTRTCLISDCFDMSLHFWLGEAPYSVKWVRKMKHILPPKFSRHIELENFWWVQIIAWFPAKQLNLCLFGAMWANQHHKYNFYNFYIFSQDKNKFLECDKKIWSSYRLGPAIVTAWIAFVVGFRGYVLSINMKKAVPNPPCSQ